MLLLLQDSTKLTNHWVIPQKRLNQRSNRERAPLSPPVLAKALPAVRVTVWASEMVAESERVQERARAVVSALEGPDPELRIHRLRRSRMTCVMRLWKRLR